MLEQLVTMFAFAFLCTLFHPSHIPIPDAQELFFKGIVRNVCRTALLFCCAVCIL